MSEFPAVDVEISGHLGDPVLTKTEIRLANGLGTRLIRALYLAAATVLIGTLALVAVLLVEFTSGGESGPWAPLGDFPDQEVLNEGPVILGDPIRVLGTKTYLERVDVLGEFGIICSDPTIAVTFGSGTGEDLLGEITTEFENRLPPEAEAVLSRYLEDNGGSSECRLVGTETATDGDRLSIPATWRTGPFILTLDE